MTLWAIWYARCKAIHEQNFQSPLSTHYFVDRFIAELGLVKPVQKARQQRQDPIPKWIPPPSGLAKINVDAATSKNSSSASVAAVARDSTGLFLGASTVTFSGISDPETLEAMACREGLALASDLLLQRIMVASDCINAIRSIQEESMGQYGQITKEIKATSEQFLNVDFIHERRESNHDAHSLARSAIYDTLGRRVWLIDPPAGVCNRYTSIN